MERFAQLGADIVKLWERSGGDYLNGIQNTLILAIVATIIGCIIGFVCGVLNTIPCAKSDPRQALSRQADPGDRAGLCGGLPGHTHDAPGRVHLLRPALLHQ